MTDLSPAQAGALLVCCECFALRDPEVRDDGHPPQLCDCAPQEVRDAQPRFGDFNKRAELCYVCGLTLISSGSRWSPFHCRECMRRVQDLNASVGLLIVPIGRHSLMNGVGSPRPNVSSELQEFVDGVNDMNVRISDISDYSRQVVRRNLWLLGLPSSEHIPVRNYLEACASSSLDKLLAFQRLLDWLASGE